MQIRRPAIDVDKFYGDDKEWTNEYISDRLREYANFLKEDARDVLSGDFSIFPEFKKLRAHYRRQKIRNTLELTVENHHGFPHGPLWARYSLAPKT
jgi:hypothetical protein